MKRFFLSFLALMLPWVILIIYDNPGGAVLALVLQASGIGWIPASFWAWRIVHYDDKHKKTEQKTKKKGGTDDHYFDDL